jgi:hypothetical protein
MSKLWRRWLRVVPVEPPWNLTLQAFDFAGADFVLNRLMISRDKTTCQDALF